ncbi:related to meiotic recombination protein rec8 [Ustilago trichophora]|uniref:Related to meiotic recombination protein rec8 n=1 Tax=Ustilago trichophora TaxID=86804 RepID=A0A5C3DRH9_9BASI|nr:related to meiotic recombination protein rec8 [Ustilago trichophora]
MFYNNDILSRRKTGLGIVWLAATLGDRSIIRRLTRRDILSVNISRTCASVLRPTEPLALRLSSQLMYGVVKLYGHQMEILYQDTANVQSDVRRYAASTVMGTREIDMRKAVKANVEAITLPLDLTFFALDFDELASRVEFRWSVEPPEERRAWVEGLEDGFRTPTPVRFIEEEERITLPRRALEEEELGLPRGYGEEGEEMAPMLGEGYEEEEGFEGLDLGLEPPRLEPITPGALEGLQLRGIGDDTTATGPLVEWPELEERLAEEAARMELGPVIEGVPTVTPARRPRQEEEEAALLARPAQRPRAIPLPYEDRETELSEDQLRTARADYPDRMASEREAIQRRRQARAADATVRRMLLGPPQDLSLNPLLSDMWEMTVGLHLLSQRARFRAMRTEAGVAPLAEAPPTPPPPTPIEEEEAEVGVARAATAEAELELPTALRGARESLPWNVFMEHRRRSSMMPSISYERPTFERETTPLRPREVSVETPTGLRRLPSPLLPPAPATPSTIAPLEEFYQPPLAETPSVERFRLGLPTAPRLEEQGLVVEEERSPTPPAQIFQEEMEEETRNFLEYARAVRDELEDPTFLFFSDLAPVASSTPAVAAQAFYHTLALASKGRIKVNQQEAYQQIRITLVAS